MLVDASGPASGGDGDGDGDGRSDDWFCRCWSMVVAREGIVMAVLIEFWCEGKFWVVGCFVL